MANCAAGRCSIECGSGCYCISISASPTECFCDCEAAPLKPERVSWLTPESEVDFHASEIPITKLAALFDVAFPKRIAVPAVRLQKTLTMKAEKVKLTELLKQCDLVVLDQGVE